MYVEINTKNLDRWLKGLPVNAFLRKLAYDSEADIKDNFSPNSPSEAGQPPAVDTGNMKNNIKVKPDGNDWVLIIGTDYAMPLEYGTRKMRPRPYVRPAIRRVTSRITHADFIKVFE